MNAQRADSRGRRGIRAGLGAVCLCALVFATVVASSAVVAQDDRVLGRVIQGRSKPYRDTVKKMEVREAEIVRKIRAGLLPMRIYPRPDHQQKPKFPPKKKTVDARTFEPPGAGAPRQPGTQAPQVIGSNFEGSTLQEQITELASSFIPPDTMGAVGPNHFVVAINGAVAIYNKSNGARVSLVSLDSFFFISASLPEGSAFDPRILYDRPSGRWFACALDFGVSNRNNHIILAVSETSDPTLGWDKYSFTAGDANDFADYETLAVDPNGVYFGWRMFFGEEGYILAATPKADLIAASPALGPLTAFPASSDMYSTPQPAANLDGSAGGRAFFVSSSATDFADVSYKTISWSGSTPTLSALGNVDTPNYGGLANFTPSGSTTPINVGDDRMMMAMIRNNRLWCARTVHVNNAGGSSGTDRNAAEWFELNVSTATATLVQSGRVYDPNAGPRHYFYPSIAVNGQGHAAMGFSGAKTSEFLGAYTCGRLTGDSAGSMQAVDQIIAGVAAYTLNDSFGRNRWGDYSYTTVDPNDDMTLWTIQEYAAAQNSGQSRWSTRIAKLMAPAPTLANPGASANQGDNDKVVNLTGTGFFDPGASFPNRLDVTISGDGISGKSVAFTNSITASVTFDIAAGATIGTRDITLTNPDGQSVTVMGALTINQSGMPAPTNLNAVATNATRVDLTWEDNSPDELGFKIERAVGMGAFSQIKTVGVNVEATADITASPNTSYIYRVRAYKTGVDSGYSNEDPVTTPPVPNAPSGLSATAITGTRIDLAWTDNSNNETSFKVERKTGVGGTYAQIGAALANATTFISNSGLSPSTQYFYQVRASNANGFSPYSNEANATTKSVPAAPTTLTATATSSTRIQLGWIDNATDETGYKIERKTGAGAYSELTQRPANTAAFINSTGLSPGTSYTYRVRAFNANGNSSYSNEEPESTPPLPLAPSGCNATAVNASRIDIVWVDESSDETSFKIERKTGAGAFAQIGASPANATSFVNNSGLSPNTAYIYRVRASNANGLSNPSNEDTASTPPVPNAPSGLNATAISSTRIDLVWVDNANDETGFKVERKTGVGGTYAQIVTRAANVTTYSNTGLTANTTYFYRVRANNANGNSNYSNEDSDTTLAGPSRQAAASSRKKSSGGRAPVRSTRPSATIRRRP